MREDIEYNTIYGHIQVPVLYPTRRACCEGLLDILPRRGPNAYGSLKRALKATGQAHVIQLLEETQSPDEVIINCNKSFIF